MNKLDFVLLHGTIGIISKPVDKKEAFDQAQKGNKPYIYHPHWEMPPITMYTSDLNAFAEILFKIMESEDEIEIPTLN